MANFLSAVTYLVTNSQSLLSSQATSNNRINSMGEPLETYIKDIFAETLFVSDEAAKRQKYNATFSYQGNQKNPPDLILKNGDAIEVKKIEKKNSGIALNSSYPKAKLFANDLLITAKCRNCEMWQEKDMIYAIGVVSENKLKALWLIYGDCYAASKDKYERIKEVISSGISAIQGVEFSKTKELGKVKKVDPIGITDLRIRGLWHIKNPISVFNSIYQYIDSVDFQLVVVVRKSKYDSMPIADRLKLASLKIKNPDAPSLFIEAKLISYHI
jgi:hypothetical protein